MSRQTGGIHKFSCPKHGRFEKFVWHADAAKGVKCEKCGKSCEMVLVSGKHAGMDYDQPVLSDAMGVHPDQLAAERKRHPDLNFTDDGRVILRNHYERKKVMKRLGFFDKDGY